MAEEEESKKSSGSSPMKLIMVMIVGGILLVAVSIGGVFFMMKSMGMLDGKSGGGAHKQEKVVQESKPAIYFSLEPAFVVNFKERGRTRFLQVTMDIMTTNQKIIDEMEKHMPLIRNNILILLSKQEGEVLQSGEGKEKIREIILKELQTIMTEKTGLVKTVEALYITSYVTQ